jgi:hypothetical protein
MIERQVLVKDENGKYSVSGSWKEVADWLKEPSCLKIEILGLEEWLHPRGLVACP